MRLLKRLVFAAVVLSIGGSIFFSPLCFATRGGAYGVINQSGNGTVVKTSSGKVLSIVLIATFSAGGAGPAEVAIFNSSLNDSGTVVWEGRVSTASDSYTHTFQTPLECPDGITVQVANGKAFLEYE